MEQPKQPKRMLCVRVEEAGYEHIEHRADRADVDISRMTRRMLAFASKNMPEGWVPDRELRGRY